MHADGGGGGGGLLGASGADAKIIIVMNFKNLFKITMTIKLLLN